MQALRMATALFRERLACDNRMTAREPDCTEAVWLGLFSGITLRCELRYLGLSGYGIITLTSVGRY